MTRITRRKALAVCAAAVASPALAAPPPRSDLEPFTLAAARTQNAFIFAVECRGETTLWIARNEAGFERLKRRFAGLGAVAVAMSITDVNRGL